jgi:hypothetical protein
MNFPSRTLSTRLILMLLIWMYAVGCRSLGPRTIPHDRSDFSAALADSWKSMMLLNIVNTRYLDLARLDRKTLARSLSFRNQNTNST